MSELELPERDKKPRKKGVTSIHDVGVSTEILASILKDYHMFVDIAKFGIGTAYVTPNLTDKINLYRKYDIEVYFGGTLFEKYYSQGKLDQYLSFLDENGINTLEISCGTIDISLSERLSLVNQLKNDYTVYAEVGSKDADVVMPPSVWIEEIESFLESGCKYVITEARDSGTAGLFRPSGEVRTGLLDDIVHKIDVKGLIFEAPTQKSQMFFINSISPDVNLGNINPYDILVLETERRALRSETFSCC